MFTIGDLVEFKFGVGIHQVIHVTAKEIGIYGILLIYTVKCFAFYRVYQQDTGKNLIGKANQILTGTFATYYIALEKVSILLRQVKTTS